MRGVNWGKWLWIFVFICSIKIFNVYSADYEDNREDDEQITVTQNGKEDFTYVLSTSLSRLKAPSGYKFDTTTGSGSPGDEPVEYSGSNASYSYMESAASLPTDSFTISMNGKLIPENPSGSGGETPTWSASGKTKARLRVVENRATYDGTQEITFRALRGNTPTNCTWVLEPTVPGLPNQSGETLVLKKYGEEKTWVFPESKEYTFYAQDDTDQKAYAVVVNQAGKEYDSIDIGPFHLTFEPALQGEYTSEGTWKYTTPSGKLSCNISDLYTVNLNTHGVQVAFEIKDDKLYSASVSWAETNEESQKISIFDATLNRIEGTFSNDRFTGSVDFGVKLIEDQDFGEFYKFVWRKGASGAFKYTYSSADAGAWDFSINGLKADMLLNEKVIAQAAVSNIDQDGTCKGVALKLTANAVDTFTMNGFKFSFNKLEGNFDYNFVNKEFSFKSGTGKITMNTPKGIQGKFSLDLVLDENSMTGTVTGKKIPAFGGNLEGEIAVVFDSEFMDLSEISGNDIEYVSPKIKKQGGANISDVEFSIINGELKSLNIDAMIIEYSQVFFKLSKATYSNEMLVLNSSCEIGKNVSLDVKGFTISSEGTIILEKISANVNLSPVHIKGNLALASSSIAGSLGVSIGSSQEFNCSFTAGKAGDGDGSFNYGQLIIHSQFSNGLPLGTTGFQLFSVSGVAGYNHTVKGSVSNFSLGSPKENHHEVGFNLGIKDSASLLALNGGAKIILGTNSAFSIGGGLAIPATGDHYVEGSATVSYQFNQSEVKGTVSAEVNIPKKTGSIFKVNNSALNFTIDKDGVDISAKGKGQLLSKIDLDLRVFNCEYKHGSFSGRSEGTFQVATSGSYRFPENFGMGEASENTSAGFGILWNYNLSLAGGYNITLLPDNYTGSVYANVGGDMDVYMKWKGFLWWDGSEIIQQAKIEGKLDITEEGNSLVASGKVNVKYQQGVKELDFSCNIAG